MEEEPLEMAGWKLRFIVMCAPHKTMDYGFCWNGDKERVRRKIGRQNPHCFQ